MRTLQLLFTLLIVSSLRAQTLYWVGGSGNFDDPSHWSLSSNGSAANIVPNRNSDLVFDDASSSGNLVITIVGRNYARSVVFQNHALPIYFAGNSNTELHINGEFQMNPRTFFPASTQLFFNSSSGSFHDIRFGSDPYQGNITFQNGNWNIKFLNVADNRLLKFNSGNYRLNSGYLKAGNLETSNGVINFEVNKGIISVNNELTFGNGTKFTGSDLALRARTSDPQSYHVPANFDFGSNAKIVNAVMVACNATLTSQNVSCSGVCNGMLILNIDAGCVGNPTPFQIVWNNPSCSTPAPQFSTTVPGPGTYTITNVCSCNDQFSAVVFDNAFSLLTVSNGTTVTGPSAINLVIFNPVMPLCNGNCNGSVVGNLSGGTPPYTLTATGFSVGTQTFAIGGGNTTFTNMCGGIVHNYTVTDANGCVRTFTNSLPNQPAPLSANFSVTNVPCFGFCTGSAVVTPTGGTAGYTVTLSPGGTFTIPTGGSTSTTGLCAGVSVSATVIDTKGCTSTGGPAVITQPATVNIVPTQTNVSCFGLCNGAASVQVSGGVAPYTYTWGPTSGTNPGITNLCSGVQIVTVTNNGGQCTNTISFNITQPTSVSLNPTVTNVTCAGICNGSVVTSPSGGAGGYQFTWTPAPGGGQNTGTITALCGTSVYVATILDNAGCTNTAAVTVTAPAAYTVTAITASATCNGTCNGSASLTVSGNNAPYNYTWSPAPGGGQGTGTVTGLCGQNYTVNITSAAPNNCPTTAIVTIAQPPPLVANITSASLSCAGVCNGSIGANPTGGNGAPYSYTLITPVPSTITTAPPYNGLCAGLYTLIIGDGGACPKTFTVNLSQPNPLVPSINVTNLTCFTVCTGVVSGNVAGGVPGYTFAWNTPTGNATGPVLSNQCAGAYTLTVTDLNGCTATANATITQPTQLQATLNVTNPMCNAGPCNGIINANIAGGTPGYTFNWNIGSGNPNVNLCAGNYTLTVLDNNGCTRAFTTALVAPPPITITQTVLSASCSGSCNGTATISAGGGVAPYTYSFTNPALTNTTGLITGLCAGNHTVTVIDANNCSQTFIYTSVNPPVLSISINSISSSCNVCIGGGTVTVSGGTPTYNIVWTNSVNAVVGNGTTASNLCPGPITITATDQAGCSVAVNTNVAQTVSVSVVVAGSGILCNNACTGSAVATATGGLLPYSFSWTPSGQTLATASVLCPNTIYSVTVTDFNLCSNTATISLTNPPAITITATQTNIVCGVACSGIISATATGGTGPLSYSWMPSGLTTPSIGNVCAGTVTLQVKDANNCTKIQIFTITSTPSISATFTTSNPTGCANNNGSICVSASGGSGGPYTYTWMPGAMTTSCISGLSAGIYSVTISDGTCAITTPTSITNPSGPSLTITPFNVACFGANTGSATAVVTGTAPFGFTWTGVGSFTNGASTSTASGLVTGTYNLSVTDGNSCVTSQTFFISQAPQMTVSTTSTNQKCNPPNPCNGSITVSPSGATPNYTVSFLPAGPTLTVTPGGTVASGGLCNGNYTANITDANGCIQSRTFALIAPPALTINATPVNVLCFNQCTGSIAGNATGGTAPISYSWLPVGSFTGAITGTINNLCANVYTLIVTDGNTCTATQTVAVTQPSSALTSSLVSLNATCNNSCNATATITGNGGTPTYSFSWTGSPATTSTVGSLCAGNYTGTITDANGCTSSQPFTVTVPSPMNVTVIPTSPLCTGQCNGSFSTVVSGNQGTVSYVWAPAGVGPNPTGLCGISYTLTVTDAAGCQVPTITSLTDPLPLLANTSFTNASCAASCNGVALSTPANAQGTVSFVWNPGNLTTASISSLCPNVYTVTVTDQNSCTATQQVTISAPASLSLNPGITPATCGFSNGAVSVGVSGGTPTYNFVWTPPVGTGSTATNLGPGLYTVNVIDANNCANSVGISVSSANGPSLAPISSTNLACFGATNAAASVATASISGGTPNYTVSWVVPPAPSSVNPISGLGAGTYTAQIVDANACVLFTAVTITQPTSVNINPSFTLATCNGSCNGIVVLNTSGGTPGYNYTWTAGGTPSQGTLTNACAGNYTVTVLDNANCLSTQTLNLPSALNMVATTSVSANPCSNSCVATGSVLNIQFGLSPYNISWSNGQTGSVSINMCAGVYSVMITDANGCFNTFTTNITSPSPITATNTIAAPTCGMCNGASTVVASGGTPGFTYSWTAGGTGTVASNLCAGLYQVLITDQNGCTMTQNVPISSSSGITGETFTVQNETCLGMCNGSVDVTPIGGLPTYSFSWINPVANTSSVTGLCPGTYFVQMTDANGCIRTSSVQIGSTSAMTISPFITQPSCPGPGNNGAITINIAGGTPSYNIVWAAPVVGTGTTVNGLGAGVYSVTITDQGGCSQTQVFNMSNTNSPILTFTQSNVGCFGTATGSIVVATNDTNTPITYSWTNGNTTPTVTGVGAGVVTVSVTNGSGCTTIQSFTVTQNPPMMLSISNITQPRCFGDVNGDITLVPSGGTLPYTFSWTPVTSTANPLTGLGAGTFTATVIDSRGCFTTCIATVTNPPQFTVSNTFTNSSCSSSADGAAIETGAGGTGTLSYNWTGPNSFSATTNSIGGLQQGTYYVTITDTRSCTATDSVKIVPTISLVAAAAPNPTVCENGTVTLDGSPSSGSIGGFSWIMLPNQTTTLATTNTISVSPGVGTSSYVLQVISTGSACIDTQMVLVNVFQLPQVSAGPNYTIPMFSSVTIGGNPTSPTGISFTWTPAFTLDNPSIQNPMATNTVNTIYTVMTVDANGCVNSATIEVDIYPEIKIPNGFSPNGDNRNDKWVIDNMDQFPDNVVEVYNRWGELLFYQKGYNSQFDGKYNGKDLPVGTYYYVINLNHPAYTKPYTGPLTIFR